MRQNDADTWYDQNGHIVFTPSMSLAGVGLPRTKRASDLKTGIHYCIRYTGGNEQDVSLGWEDVKYLKQGVVTKMFMDDTLPGGPIERTIEYQAPFVKPDREEDYKRAWAFFESSKDKA